MPKELKQRMQDYFQTVWSMNHGIDINEVNFHRDCRNFSIKIIPRERALTPTFFANPFVVHFNFISCLFHVYNRL